MSSFSETSDELIVLILQFLNSRDISFLSQAYKGITFRPCFATAIRKCIENSQRRLSSLGQILLPATFGQSIIDLHFSEVKFISLALNSQTPLSPKGFWASTVWVSEAKKYYESHPILDVFKPRKVGSRKCMKIPVRPLSIAGDLECPHGLLSPAATAKVRRKAINAVAWKYLRSFFPIGPEFKVSSSPCPSCSALIERDQATTAHLVSVELLRRRSVFCSDLLEDLLSRKSGVPACAVNRDLTLNSTPFSVRPPLKSGLYCIVPKEWLRRWRLFVRSPDLTGCPAPLDLSGCFCDRHNRFTVPSHVSEYLCGYRRALLANLADYMGEVFEVLSIDEWDEMVRISASWSGQLDFSILFSVVDGEAHWSAEICELCDSTKKPNINSHFA